MSPPLPFTQFQSWQGAVFPLACLSCDQGDQPVCSNCWPKVKLHTGAFQGFPKVSASDYQDLKSFLLPYKDRSLTVLNKLFGTMAAEALRQLDAVCDVKGCLTLVYPPSSARNWRKRGFNPAEHILKSAAKQLPADRWRIKPAFRFVRQVGDQGELNRLERGTNLAGSLRSTLSGEHAVVIFDDVSATGSTLNEMSRALEATDNQIVGYCLLSESFLKTDSGASS